MRKSKELKFMQIYSFRKTNCISVSRKKESTILALLFCIGFLFLFLNIRLMNDNELLDNIEFERRALVYLKENKNVLVKQELVNIAIKTLVVIEDKKVIVDKAKSRISCYNSVSGQTDGSPWITSSGYRLKIGDKIVANNYYKFGTKLSIDGVIYEVQDRMNRRYGKYNVDIWFGGKVMVKDCIQFGVRYLDVKVIPR